MDLGFSKIFCQFPRYLSLTVHFLYGNDETRTQNLFFPCWKPKQIALYGQNGYFPNQ